MVIESRVQAPQRARESEPEEDPRRLHADARREPEEGGLGKETIRRALAAWVSAGFPEGKKYRECGAPKLLKKLRLPKAWTWAANGTWGARQGEKGSVAIYRTFRQGSVAWRLPWKSDMSIYIGLRSRPTSRFMREPSSEGNLVARLVSTTAEPTGQFRLKSKSFRAPSDRYRNAFILVWTVSPSGLTYSFLHQYVL